MNSKGPQANNAQKKNTRTIIRAEAPKQERAPKKVVKAPPTKIEPPKKKASKPKEE